MLALYDFLSIGFLWLRVLVPLIHPRLPFVMFQYFDHLWRFQEPIDDEHLPMRSDHLATSQPQLAITHQQKRPQGTPSRRAVDHVPVLVNEGDDALLIALEYEVGPNRREISKATHILQRNNIISPVEDNPPVP